MRIEIWMDYLCPITYLTHTNLLKAIEELKLEDYEIIYRSFEMIKYKKGDYSIMDVWMLHHNESEDEIRRFLGHLYPEYEKLKYTDVNGAHQLSHLAKRFNVQKEINTDILKAFFEDNIDIGNIETLISIGEKHGMCRELITSTIKNNTFREPILLNRENAFIRGIDRIPHIRINIKNHYNGYISKFKFKDILVANTEEENLNTICIGADCNLEKAF